MGNNSYKDDFRGDYGAEDLAHARMLLEEGRVSFTQQDGSPDFYLGVVVRQSFFLAANKLSQALAQIRPEDPPQSLRAYWEEWAFDIPTFDDAGNVTALPIGSGGDIWPFGELEAIADLVRAGSEYVIIDDSYDFFRLRFDGRRLIYERGEVR